MNLWTCSRSVHGIYPVSCSNIAVLTQALKKGSKNAEPEPPRITSNVKQNLQDLKLLKGLNKGEKRVPRSSSRYRRRKGEKVNLPDDIELYDDHATGLYLTSHNIGLSRPVLLVDGYNICGYWPKLRKYFMKGNLVDARQMLVEDLVTFSSMKGVKVVVVFDAASSHRPDHKETFQGIDIIFTSTLCADSWIEREVSLLNKDGCPKVWVATSDNLHRQCVCAAVILLWEIWRWSYICSGMCVGAFVWSCKMLHEEINEAKREQDEFLHQETFSMQGKLLEHNLDPEVIAALKNLKKQLQQRVLPTRSEKS
eukprot:c12948_g1_i3 orf=260-1189(+)